MRLTLTLDTTASIALRRLANERGEDLEAVAAALVRDGLLAVGAMEIEHELDEETETVGSA